MDGDPDGLELASETGKSKGDFDETARSEPGSFVTVVGIEATIAAKFVHSFKLGLIVGRKLKRSSED